MRRLFLMLLLTTHTACQPANEPDVPPDASPTAPAPFSTSRASLTPNLTREAQRATETPRAMSRTATVQLHLEGTQNADATHQSSTLVAGLTQISPTLQHADSRSELEPRAWPFPLPTPGQVDSARACLIHEHSIQVYPESV